MKDMLKFWTDVLVRVPNNTVNTGYWPSIRLYASGHIDLGFPAIFGVHNYRYSFLWKPLNPSGHGLSKIANPGYTGT